MMMRIFNNEVGRRVLQPGYDHFMEWIAADDLGGNIDARIAHRLCQQIE
jgi:hypothetical protein